MTDEADNKQTPEERSSKATPPAMQNTHDLDQSSGKEETKGSSGVKSISSRKKAGGKKEKILKLGIGALFVGIAVTAAIWVNDWTSRYPASESGSIEAELVHAATTVGGRLRDLPIEVNEHVTAGQLLYRIDPAPYQIAVSQAEASLAFAKASLAQNQRDILVQQTNVSQTKAGEIAALERRNLAKRTVDRLRPLASKNYISTQEYDTALTHLAEADADLARSRSANKGAKDAVRDLQMAEASVQSAEAALAQAKYQLSQTELRASVPGFITSLEVKEGEVLGPGQPLFTLVSDEKWYAQANIREIELKHITEGECVTVYSMIDRHVPMRGVVVSIGHGVAVSGTTTLPFSVPFVQRTMDWVHIAQRFPVRILLPKDHPDLLRMGATATVEIGRGRACAGKPQPADNIENIEQAQAASTDGK